MIRATTGGVMKTYRRNLMSSFIASNKARETVLTQRVFNSYAEDPASAAKAFRLRKSRMTVNAQHDVCFDTLKKHETAYSCLQSVSELIDTENGTGYSTLKDTTLRMLNDPEGSARTQLAKVLDQISESVIQNMNQKYGDIFIFAGADGHNVPFEVKEVDGMNKLYYRGVPVDAAEPKLMDDSTGNAVMLNGDYVLANATLVSADKLPALEPDPASTGDPLTVTSASGGKAFYVKAGATGSATEPAANPEDYTEVSDGNGQSVYYLTSDLVDKTDYDSNMASVIKDANGNPDPVTIGTDTYYVVQGGTMTEEEYKTAMTDAAKLKVLMDEKKYVDIGLGFQENENDQLIASSAYNTALHGPAFIGYGLDEDGDPKNVYSLVQEMKRIADSVGEGEEWTTEQYDEFYGLVQKFEKSSTEFKTAFTNHAAGTTKLENNEKLLSENFYNLKEQYSDLEDVDMVEAISSFLWAEYAYNAALKVGNSVLSQSLMDYIS